MLASFTPAEFPQVEMTSHCMPEVLLP